MRSFCTTSSPCRAYQKLILNVWTNYPLVAEALIQIYLIMWERMWIVQLVVSFGNTRWRKTNGNTINTEINTEVIQTFSGSSPWILCCFSLFCNSSTSLYSLVHTEFCFVLYSISVELPLCLFVWYGCWLEASFVNCFFFRDWNLEQYRNCLLSTLHRIRDPLWLWLNNVLCSFFLLLL